MSRAFSALALAALLSPLMGCGPKSGAAADSSSAAAPQAAAPAMPAADSSSATASAQPDARVTRADIARTKGDPNAKLWLMVVSDFQCPYCGQWERETAPAVMKEYVETGKVRLAFVNWPLNMHPNAWPAAEAAMCAGAQDKFWEMHDRIFQTQEQWSGLPDSPPFFEKFASELKLDVDAYKACIKDHVMRPMIESDAKRAQSAGANSTPTFYIGNLTISGAEKIEAFRSAIAQAQAALPK